MASSAANPHLDIGRSGTRVANGSSSPAGGHTDPCIGEADIERMVAEDPEGLLRIIAEQRLEPTLLTYAAEYAGRIPDAARVVPVLMALLQHDKAYVREGAVYGLGLHLDAQGARVALQALAVDDREPGVRDAAREMLLS